MHRYVLLVNNMTSDLEKVLDEALQSRLFKKMCEEMGSLYESLLLHTEIWCLSRGIVLARLYEHRDELRVFQMLLHHEQWLIKLPYVANIFIKVNEIIILLLRKNNHIYREVQIISVSKELKVYLRRKGQNILLEKLVGISKLN